MQHRRVRGLAAAAPILLEMIERQEGLAGGYYTGIATIADGTAALGEGGGRRGGAARGRVAIDAPGTIGLAHSRSNSGGDVAWAHPFIACDDSLAYIANGAAATSRPHRRQRGRAATWRPAGTVTPRVADEAHRPYPVLEDGRCVHVSDVMAHAIEERWRPAGAGLRGHRAAFLELPAEIVGLFITPTHRQEHLRRTLHHAHVCR